MEIREIIQIIEKFAPLETQEAWDCSGWQIEPRGDFAVEKIMLCLTVTEDIIEQAQSSNCDLILAHHPLFFIPFSFNKQIPIYSAHTNLDKADGGTTDTMIKLMGFENRIKVGDFLRIVDCDITLENLIFKIKKALNIPYVRVVNPKEKSKFKRLAFCAGSGSEFSSLALQNGADVLITGDLKYHTAVESDIALIDVGHFESEYPVLSVLKQLLSGTVFAQEESPFKTY